MAQQVVKRRLSDLVASQDTTILRLPTKLFDPHRILIMKILSAHQAADFRQLKHDLSSDGKEMTDGNLAGHLKALHEAGYLTVSKIFVENRPRTFYVLTEAGMNAFKQFRRNLEQVIRDDAQK